MGARRVLIPVEDIDVAREQENYDTWHRIICYDGSGEYNDDRTIRLIVWRADGDDREYPEQFPEWYPVGTLIPITEWTQP